MSGPDLRPAVRAFFDGAVREWDTERYRDPTYRGRARHALRWLVRMGPGTRVLDLGCGTGRQSADAVRAGNRVVSADFSFEMARATRDRIARECPAAAPAGVVADALHPPFRPGAFDAVMALGVVGFVPDRPAMLREAAALLRPGGELILDVGIPEPRVLFHAINRWINRPLLALRRAWRVHVRRLPASDAARTTGWYGAHFAKHAPEEIEAMLRRAGLVPLDRGGAGFGELRLLGRRILPWRVEAAISAFLGRLTGLPWGGWLARHALTYVVRSVRTPVAADVPASRAVPPPAPVPADAPALGGQLRR